MKKFYKVSFEYSEGIYCTNIAIAESAAAVKEHYSEYSWVDVKECPAWELETCRAKGMPFINVD